MSDAPPFDPSKPFTRAPTPKQTFDTQLAPAEETAFSTWKQQYAPKDSGMDYDLRGAFKAGLTPDAATGHWPDTYKKPNHPTFSDQSIYAKGRETQAGRWEGDKFIAPTAPPFDPSKPFTQASAATAGEQKPDGGSTIGALWNGLVHGAGNVLHGGARIGARMGEATDTGFGPELPKGTTERVDKTAQQREEAFLKRPETRAHPTATAIGAIGGEAAGLAAEAGPLALAAPASTPIRLLWNSLLGAGGSLAMPGTEPMDAKSTAARAATGAAGGLAVGGAGEAVGRAVAPRMSPDAAALASKGVQLTPGRMAPGPANMAKGMEDRLSGFPILGDFIKNAQRRSFRTFNEATINQALEPIGAKLPVGVNPGNEAVKAAGDIASQAYDKVLARIPKVVVDRDLQNALKAIELDARQRPAVWKNLRGELNRVQSNLKRGEFTGREAQTAGSELERVARGLQNSDNFFEREVAKHLREARSSLFDAIERQHPDVAPDLQSANAAWAMLTRIENAAGRRAASGGVFTPMDLLSAVKSGSGGVRRREFARGDALFQDWAQTAQRVLPSGVPDSGTAGRLLAEHPISALGFGAATSPAWPLYTAPGGRALQGMMTPGPGRQAVRGVIEGLEAIESPEAGVVAERHRKPRPSVVGP